MRTVPFQRVVDGVMRRHGLDAIADATSQDRLRSIVQHINKRVRYAWRIWDWPELRITEERAYRTIWNSTKQFLREGADGKPDEFIWLDDMTYYRVKADAIADPDPGIPPSNANYFETFSPVDPYISFDQVCRRPIGMVFGVYQGNPRLNGCGTRGLKFRPSEKGIDVYGVGTPSVFISYQLPPPRFSAVPYAHGKAYSAGDVVYHNYDCYIALTDNFNISPVGTSPWWRQLLFPEILSQYAIAGAFADGLRETPAFKSAQDASDLQVRIAAAQLADAEAQAFLESEIDVYMAQGQRNYYNFVDRMVRWPSCGVCVSEPWTGGEVTTLTEICETDPTYFVPPPAPGVKVFYEPAIHYILTTDGTPSLQDFPVTHLAAGSRVTFDVLTAGVYTAQTWRLFSGTSDPLDPGQVQSPDLTLYWRQVS